MRLIYVTRVVAPCAAIVLSGSGAAHACELSGFAPTAPLPTQPVGQMFSFVATDDCDAITFRTGGPLGITKVPRRGLPAGPGRHRYSVTLTESEWNGSVRPADLQFMRIVVGTTAGGPRDVGGYANWLDFDNDGWTRNLGDPGLCDVQPARNPGMTEIFGNGIDDDCDGNVDNTPLGGPAAAITTDLPTNAQLGSRGVAVGDVDGNGIADLAIPMPVRDGAVYIVQGPTTGTIDVADAVTITSAAEDIGWSASAGDVDADGIDDLLGGNTDRDGAAYLFLGPITADRDVLDADAVYAGAADSGAGEDVDIVPDIDGDGFVDVVVGGIRAGGDVGAVYVAAGVVSGTVSLGAGSTYTFEGPAPGPYFGIANFSIGDATGDGISDLALGAPAASSSSANVIYLVEGGSTPGTYDVASAAWATIGTSSDPTYLGHDIASGDYDGNGTRDLIVGDMFADTSDGSGAAYAFLGSLSGAVDVADADVRWEGDENWDTYLLGKTVEMGDVDGDDRLDVLIGEPSADAGRVHLQLGPASGVVDISSMPFFAGTDDESFGEAIVAIPDWDGDGGSEIAIGAPYAGDDTQGAVYVFASATLF